jgi:uncharacterized membrane protein YsdA (DUF1294 family)
VKWVVENWAWLAACWLLLINVLAVALTISDKKRARRHQWRIPERTLLLVSVLGGSPAMLVTMLRIRHKTKHPRFMVGIPLIILLQLAAVCFCMWKWA